MQLPVFAYNGFEQGSVSQILKQNYLESFASFTFSAISFWIEIGHGLWNVSG